MKSQQFGHGTVVRGSPAYAQKEVAKYEVFEEAMVACDRANGGGGARHYVMNGSGKEYYAGTWID
jgi:hypothetical protein